MSAEAYFHKTKVSETSELVAMSDSSIAVLLNPLVLMILGFLFYHVVTYIFSFKQKSSLSPERLNEIRERILEGFYSSLWRSKLILKSDEFIIFSIPLATLSEERSSDVRGGTSLVNVAIADGFSVGLGRFKGSSERKITEIDRGELTVTNWRLHFDGQSHSYNYNLNAITSIEITSRQEYRQTAPGIAIGRVGKTKKEYFSIVSDVSMSFESEQGEGRKSPRNQTAYRFDANECIELLRKAIGRLS